MPYEWTPSTDPDTPVKLALWPYRSLPRKGFVIFIGITAVLFLAPLTALLGSPTLWVILPFLLAAIALIWYFIERSYKDGEILEELVIWPDRIELTRTQPRKATQRWQANPYWVQVNLYPSKGPVPQYLTLKGNNREVELGAFLSEDERPVLYEELSDVLRTIAIRREN